MNLSNDKFLGSTLLVALLPAAIVLGYFSVVRYFPSKDVEKIAELEKQVALLKQQQPTEEQREALAGQLAQASKHLDAQKAEATKLQLEAKTLMSGKLSPLQQLEASGLINQLLDDAGLTMVSQTPTSTSGSDLQESLVDATKNLIDLLTAMSSEDAESIRIEIPPDLPLDMNPQIWLAQQRERLIGKTKGPEVQYREFRLVGEYAAMVRGLEGIIDSCPQAVVTSVAFERPKVPPTSTTKLIWNVCLQLRPTLEAAADDNATQDSETIARTISVIPISSNKAQTED